MYNPFTEKIAQDENDLELIKDSLAGNQEALEKLILRHQAWIYNIAFKMVMDHDDAGDITQEILIKMITSLSSYNPQKGLFRTWLYRIVVNHIISMKKQKFEMRIQDFDTYVSLIEALPDDRDFSHPDREILAEELKTGCVMGMLMCLNRTERIVFLLGVVFGVADSVGAELLEVNKANFRKMLSRSRQKIYSHMNGVCGQVNNNNPCRCENKIKTFLELGMIDPRKPRFHRPELQRVKDVMKERLDEFDQSYYVPFMELFRKQPFYDAPDMTRWLRNMLQNDEFKHLLNIH